MYVRSKCNMKMLLRTCNVLMYEVVNFSHTSLCVRACVCVCVCVVCLYLLWCLVVFDDGDERTLKRSSLVLKGGRHYQESEVSRAA